MTVSNFNHPFINISIISYWYLLGIQKYGNENDEVGFVFSCFGFGFRVGFGLVFIFGFGFSFGFGFRLGLWLGFRLGFGLLNMVIK